MDLVLTFFPSSAERRFSQLKLVKSNLRHRLGQNSVNNILANKFLSNDIHSCNPDKTVDSFFMSKKRRLRVRQTVSVPTCASVLQSEKREGRVAEVETKERMVSQRLSESQKVVYM